MKPLPTDISPGLWNALIAHMERTGESIQHVMNNALSEYLDVGHHTLYQVSTASALVEGIYQGAATVGTLREHGDLGLGTFECLDGELILIDGQCFQVHGDGTVNECDDNRLSPFAVVTRFRPNASATSASCLDLKQLTSDFDSLRHSENIFFALRVDGHFDHVHTRAMCPTRDGVPLVQAAAVQPEFHFYSVVGTLVGFWTPEYARTFNVPRYHLHFISADRKNGGHLLGCSGSNLQLQIQGEGEIRVALPEIEEFLNADLRRDPAADLAIAEGEMG